MYTEDKITPRNFKLINDKLDYLIDKVDYIDGILNDLGNITLDPPPTSIPEAPIKDNESEALGNVNTSAVSPGSLRPCVYRYVYIWPRKGHGFWAYLTRIDRISASGYRWTGHRWIYFGIDLKLIDSFQCF